MNKILSVASVAIFLVLATLTAIYYEPIVNFRPNNCTNNTQLLLELNTYNRVLVSGLRITTNSSDTHNCTLGAIISLHNKSYALTAAHCVFGDELFVNGRKVGSLYLVDNTTDTALFSLDFLVPSLQQDYCGNKIIGVATSVQSHYSRENLKVYKIGRTTGLTRGQISERSYFENYFTNEIEIESLDGLDFCGSGDSGSAIITVDHKILGILSGRSDITHTCVFYKLNNATWLEV